MKELSDKADCVIPVENQVYINLKNNYRNTVLGEWYIIYQLFPAKIYEITGYLPADLPKFPTFGNALKSPMFKYGRVQIGGLCIYVAPMV